MLLVYRPEGGGPINRNIPIRGVIAGVARWFNVFPSNNTCMFCRPVENGVLMRELQLRDSWF